jgi:hypothetical protein
MATSGVKRNARHHVPFQDIELLSHFGGFWTQRRVLRDPPSVALGYELERTVGDGAPRDDATNLGEPSSIPSLGDKWSEVTGLTIRPNWLGRIA